MHILDEHCRKFVNDSRYREGLDDDCYVPFPRHNTAGSLLSWYQARRNCLHFGGDLARSRDVLNVTSSNWPGNGKFSVGLLRDEYVWNDTGGTVQCYFSCCFSVSVSVKVFDHMFFSYY